MVRQYAMAWQRQENPGSIMTSVMVTVRGTSSSSVPTGWPVRNVTTISQKPQAKLSFWKPRATFCGCGRKSLSLRRNAVQSMRGLEPCRSYVRNFRMCPLLPARHRGRFCKSKRTTAGDIEPVPLVTFSLILGGADGRPLTAPYQ